jgi:hypothetical protein
LEKAAASTGKMYGKPQLPFSFNFLGYQTDIASILQDMDVMIYLLNPYHYGTAENALIEAMAMGVIPIVLDNPCERHIVCDGVTGFIVRNATELRNRIDYIVDHPEIRKRISENAIKDVRASYTYKKSSQEFELIYQDVMNIEKHKHDFTKVFGTTPVEWFKSFQEYPDAYHEEEDTGNIYNLPYTVTRSGNQYKDAIMFAETKGSVKHFSKYFPEDKLLQEWSKQL